MERDTTVLLNEISKSAEMGRELTRQLLASAEDDALCERLRAQLAAYEDLSRRAHAMLGAAGELPQVQRPAAKLWAHMGTELQLMRDRSPRRLAELVIQGSQTGAIELTKALRDNAEASAGAVALAERLRSAEAGWADEMEAFL